jgi:hypothetical protein
VDSAELFPTLAPLQPLTYLSSPSLTPLTHRLSQLAIFDRLAIGDQLMRLHWPGHEDELGEPMSADDAVEEFQEGLMASRSSGECACVVISY